MGHRDSEGKEISKTVQNLGIERASRVEAVGDIYVTCLNKVSDESRRAASHVSSKYWCRCLSLTLHHVCRCDATYPELAPRFLASFRYSVIRSRSSSSKSNKSVGISITRRSLLASVRAGPARKSSLALVTVGKRTEAGRFFDGSFYRYGIGSSHLSSVNTTDFTKLDKIGSSILKRTCERRPTARFFEPLSMHRTFRFKTAQGIEVSHPPNTNTIWLITNSKTADYRCCCGANERDSLRLNNVDGNSTQIIQKEFPNEFSVVHI